MQTSCATQCFEKLFCTYLDWVFSWFLNLDLDYSWFLILETWNLILDSWIVLDSILKSFSWAFCHHLCYHQNTLNQSWFIIMNQSWFMTQSWFNHEACFYNSLVVENIDNVFVSCNLAYGIWMKLYYWFEMVSILLTEPYKHWWQYCGLVVGLKKCKSLWIMWIAAMWLIWKMRNEVVFNNRRMDPDRVFEMIQLTLWKWLKAKAKGFSTSYYEWRIHPTLCL